LGVWFGWAYVAQYWLPEWHTRALSLVHTGIKRGWFRQSGLDIGLANITIKGVANETYTTHNE